MRLIIATVGVLVPEHSRFGTERESDRRHDGQCAWATRRRRGQSRNTSTQEVLVMQTRRLSVFDSRCARHLRRLRFGSRQHHVRTASDGNGQSGATVRVDGMIVEPAATRGTPVELFFQYVAAERTAPTRRAQKRSMANPI